MADDPEQKCECEKKLRRYADLLASYDAARLTGSRDAGELYDLHIRDSLHSVALLPKAGKVIDVGSGGGLPGIVWAICRPDLSVTLLDSVRKKCSAMSGFAAALSLCNVYVVWARCEEHALQEREGYDFASARALAHAGVTAEYLSPLVKPGGRVMAFKGPKGLKELEEVGERLPPPGWGKIGLSSPAVLPYGGNRPGGDGPGEGDRNYFFIIWEKISSTPKAYPRKPGAASVKGWWL